MLTFTGLATTPSLAQPRVPEEMPKVWLPRVPLVVTASTCGATPDWPSKMMVPTPQPTLFGAATAKPIKATASNDAMMNLFFMISNTQKKKTKRETTNTKKKKTPTKQRQAE